MLYCLLDDRARTSTELAVIAGVNASTGSVHLSKLHEAGLVTVIAQGKHRFYRLKDAKVAGVLEGLGVLAGSSHTGFVPTTPDPLRAARTCYDHIAGTLGVALHDRMMARGWIRAEEGDVREVTTRGVTAFQRIGIDVDAVRAPRRRFAIACLDWSERRFHLGGAMGAALFSLARHKRWVAQESDSRALRVTALGAREMTTAFGNVTNAAASLNPFRGGS